MKRRGFFASIIGASAASGLPEPTRAVAIDVSPEKAYAIEYDRPLEPEQVARFKEAWQAALGGKDLAPRLVVLHSGMRMSELKVK